MGSARAFAALLTTTSMAPEAVHEWLGNEGTGHHSGSPCGRRCRRRRYPSERQCLLVSRHEASALHDWRLYHASAGKPESLGDGAADPRVPPVTNATRPSRRKKLDVKSILSRILLHTATHQGRLSGRVDGGHRLTPRSEPIESGRTCGLTATTFVSTYPVRRQVTSP